MHWVALASYIVYPPHDPEGLKQLRRRGYIKNFPNHVTLHNSNSIFLFLFALFLVRSANGGELDNKD